MIAKARRRCIPALIECMERRLLLSASLVKALNALGVTIQGTAGNDSIVVSVGPGATLVANVNGKTSTYTPDQYRGGITIDTGSSSGTGDLLNIKGLPAAATLVQSVGPLFVSVGGGTRGMQDVAATSLTIGAAGAAQGKISLTLDDGADPIARNMMLDATNPGNSPYGIITGLSAGAIAFSAGHSLWPVTIYAGGGGNAITVNHTPNGPNINLNTGSGNDTVNVLATAAGAVFNVNGESGTDTVNVGGSTQRSLRGILGVVNVSNASGQTHLTIDDSSNSTPVTAGLDTFAAGSFTYGSLTGLAPGVVNFNGAQMASPVIINAGNGGNTINVNHTPAGPNINLNTGTGDDTVNVSATAAGTVLNLNGESGADSVGIGSGFDRGVQDIQGVVNVDNPSGHTKLVINNRVYPPFSSPDQPVTLDTFAAPSGVTWGTLQGLSPAPINFAGVHMDSVDVFADQWNGGMNLTVKNTPGGGTIDCRFGGSATVLGLAAGQNLRLEGRDLDGTVTIDYSSGRIDGTSIFADCNFINVIGASPSDRFNYFLRHGNTTIAWDDLSLDSITISNGTFDITVPDLNPLSGYNQFGLQWVATDTTFVLVDANVDPNSADFILPITGGVHVVIPDGVNIPVRGLVLDGYLDLGTGGLSWFDSGTGIRQKVQGWIASGLTGGRGITSSAADAHHTVGFTTSTSADGRVTVTAKYALYGDANLDGKVDFNDLVILAQNYGKTGVFWQDGDFNYDGKVDFADLVKLAQNYGKSA